ncbi:MAG: hypothetical protein Q7S20_06240 [Gemmatimonadaceae bacterium]|nr:hypothetical protein [Gemmatimonadaceae bacterium]
MMFFDPRAIFLLIVLVGVTGWVAKSLIVTWYNLSRGGKTSGDSLREMEERLKQVEAVTSGLIMDMTSMREKERFMARLQASASTHEAQGKSDVMKTSELSPMVTQSIPVVPRARSPRN